MSTGSKLRIKVGIEQNENLLFAKRGTIKTKCPYCDCEIIFELEGLQKDKSLSPTINWSHEWYLEEEVNNENLGRRFKA